MVLGNLCNLMAICSKGIGSLIYSTERVKKSIMKLSLMENLETDLKMGMEN